MRWGRFSTWLNSLRPFPSNDSRNVVPGTTSGNALSKSQPRRMAAVRWDRALLLALGRGTIRNQASQANSATARIASQR